MNPIMDRDHRMRTAPSIPHHEIIWKTGNRASLGVLVFPPLGLGSPQRHAILVPHKMLANTILPELEVHDFTRHFSLKVLSPAPHSFADGWVERLLAPSAACSTAEVRHERRGERGRRCGCGHGRGGRRHSRGRRHGLLARRRRRSVGAGRRAARRWAYGRTSLLLVVQAPRSWKRNGLAPVGRTIALELAVIHHLSPTRWWLGTHRHVRSSSLCGLCRTAWVRWRAGARRSRIFRCSPRCRRRLRKPLRCWPLGKASFGRGALLDWGMRGLGCRRGL